jgi:eukaryotic-like serine/threonine-protein kinase
MILRPGAHLGPYEIQAAVGAGGMGEVYKARDTRLDRTVAIKILAAEVSHDPEGRLRFEREARAIAALSHPHICTLHDIGTHDGTTYLVMEHLAGESLATRLIRGPIPLGQAVAIAAQIADALDAAHKHGIVHRDLKPGNVMLTAGGAGHGGDVSAKLLDFGLAKLAGHGARPALVASASAPTEVEPATAPGTLVGTLQYMAPEQLEGKEVDARTDVWALGAILYEMVTGRRAFAGESPVSLIGNIMHAEPAGLSTLQPLTPPALERLVRKCLAKRPDDRWDGAHDVADELRWIAQTQPAEPAPARRASYRTWAVAVAAGLAGLLLGGGGAMQRVRVPAPGVPSMRLSLDVSPADELYSGGVLSRRFIYTTGGTRTSLAWTPDGTALVFVGRRADGQQLYLRRLDGSEARPLANTEGAQVPAVSPDGRWVAFWATQTLRKVPLDGGPAMDLATGVGVPKGLAWDSAGRLFFGRDDDGRIWQVAPDGTVTAVTTLGEGERGHFLPWPLPGGRTLLYGVASYSVARRSSTWDIVAHRLATGERKRLVEDAADARYVPTGHLLFLRRGTLFAVPFDAEHLDVHGPAVAVLDRVAQALTAGNVADITGAGQFAVSATGTMALVSGAVVPFREGALVSLDRTGQVTPLPAPLRTYGPGVRFSPDGRHAALTILDVGPWLYAADRGTLSLLAGEGGAGWPLWSPDGRRLAFSSIQGGVMSIALQPADGSAPRTVLLRGDLLPSSWTPDGRHLAAVGRDDIVVVSVADGRVAAQPLGETPERELWPEFSPDGRWLAYGSDVTGRFEVYIRPYPGPGAPQQVSIDGGESPAWNPGGRELFFVGRTGEVDGRSMLVADVDTRFPLRVGRTRTLFRFTQGDLAIPCTPVRCYDVSADGRRFYAVQRRPRPATPPVTHVGIITNWFEELRAKVPTRP